MAGDSALNVYCVSKKSAGGDGGSKLSFLTSGDGAGKINIYITRISTELVISGRWVETGRLTLFFEANFLAAI